MRKFSVIMFSSLFVIICADISRDYAQINGVPLRYMIPGLQMYVDGLMSIIIGILACLGLAELIRQNGRVRIKKEVINFLLMLAIVYVYGAIVGFLQGNKSIYILGEFQNLTVYFAVFAIGSSLVTEKTILIMYKAFFVACVVMVLKVVLASMVDYSQNIGYFRVLVKGAAYFQIMTILAFSLYVESETKKDKRMYLLLTLLGFFGVVASYQRGYFLALLGGGIFYLVFGLSNKLRLKYLLQISVVLLVFACAWSAISQHSLNTIFGRWSGEGTSFEGGYDYRVYQAETLVKQIQAHYITGNGLGSYLGFGYEGYDESLSKPYILELDFLNYVMKLGVVGSLILWGAFAYIIILGVKVSRRAKTATNKALLIAGSACVLSMLIANLFNAMYSSVMFHMFVVLYLLTIIAVDSDTEDSRFCLPSI